MTYLSHTFKLITNVIETIYSSHICMLLLYPLFIFVIDITIDADRNEEHSVFKILLKSWDFDGLISFLVGQSEMYMQHKGISFQHAQEI